MESKGIKASVKFAQIFAPCFYFSLIVCNIRSDCIHFTNGFILVTCEHLVQIGKATTYSWISIESSDSPNFLDSGRCHSVIEVQGPSNTDQHPVTRQNLLQFVVETGQGGAGYCVHRNNLICLSFVLCIISLEKHIHHWVCSL